MEPEQWVPPGPPKDRRDAKKTVKLPETPKTAEEMWQHSVIGDYLAKYRVSCILIPYQRQSVFLRIVLTPALTCVWFSIERSQKGTGGDGGSLEINGEEGEDSMDQESSRGPEALRGSVPARGQ